MLEIPKNALLADGLRISVYLWTGVQFATMIFPLVAFGISEVNAVTGKRPAIMKSGSDEWLAS